MAASFLPILVGGFLAFLEMREKTLFCLNDKRITYLLFWFSSVLLHNSFEWDDCPEPKPLNSFLTVVFMRV